MDERERLRDALFSDRFESHWCVTCGGHGLDAIFRLAYRRASTLRKRVLRPPLRPPKQTRRGPQEPRRV
jgi:hypothetical protein